MKKTQRPEWEIDGIIGKYSFYWGDLVFGIRYYSSRKSFIEQQAGYIIYADREGVIKGLRCFKSDTFWRTIKSCMEENRE